MEEDAIRGMSKKPSDMSLMILGSTIEYRSLCRKLGIKPHVVDFSRANFDALSAYSKEKFTDEIFVESDWLQIPFTETFDVILGHRPFNVIRHDQVGVFFKKMHDSLKKEGVFFCRGNVRFPGDQDHLALLVEQWGKAATRPHRLFSYLEVPLYMHCADARGYLDYPKARDVIRKFHEQKFINDSDYEDIQPLISMPEGTKFRSFIAKEELEEHIRAAGFRSIEWLLTSHTFTKNMPIIKLIK